MAWRLTPIQTRMVRFIQPQACASVFFAVAVAFLIPLRPRYKPNLSKSFCATRPWPPQLKATVLHTLAMLGQTYLAYTTAAATPHTAVAGAYTALVAVSCLVTPYYIAYDHLGLVDALDSVTTLLIAVVFPTLFVLVPTATVIYGPQHDTGSTVNQYAWYAELVASWRLLAVTSVAKLVAMIAPSALQLGAIEATLAALSCPPPSIKRPSVQCNRIRFPTHKRWVRLLIGFNVVWGLGVLCLSLYAIGHSSACPAHCTLEARPWFSAACACVYARLDCRTSVCSLDGDEERYLNVDLLGSSLMVLHTLHCSLPRGLQPQTLTPFEELFAYAIEYSNMTSWEIPPSAYPASLALAYIRYSQLTALPVALASPPLHLVGIYIDSAPIVNVPDAVWANWTHLSNLWLSNVSLQVVPESIAALRSLQFLVLSSNNLSTVPDAVSTLPLLQKLYLDANPITEFPTSLITANPTLDLALDQTRIADVPDTPAVRAALTRGYVHLGSTPFCAHEQSYHWAATLRQGVCDAACAPFCANVRRGNGFCDAPCNVAVCGFDNGDCAAL
ncbi:hypothetical protein SDRG_15343 [Saprolegnia diclina VS20]|uniref:LNR domain-containing protein n=1 Tax=Saprolegnia diclina (strain VS20) TaxID=1156394 RepID=T0RBA4_SAPDV|nr:hypothetical protein SDRG_15343 [Saprolegnia diclina VS20]EQC26832.1 hypothetical protein SDRG_15343 [Saprolegnia diclina VS20]|eukprot:XP_008619734.1 hypothetical protein SDRG_15343 [Saprolegnia diclina VS20]